MNRKVITKYKVEFDYWLEGKPVVWFYKNELKDMEYDKLMDLSHSRTLNKEGQEFQLNNENIIFMKMDSMFKFRLAEAVGYQILYQGPNTIEWEKCSTTDLVFINQSAGRYKYIETCKPKWMRFNDEINIYNMQAVFKNNNRIWDSKKCGYDIKYLTDWKPQHNEFVLIEHDGNYIDQYSIEKYDENDPISCYPLESINDLILLNQKLYKDN